MMHISSFLDEVNIFADLQLWNYAQVHAMSLLLPFLHVHAYAYSFCSHLSLKTLF